MVVGSIVKRMVLCEVVDVLLSEEMMQRIFESQGVPRFSWKIEEEMQEKREGKIKIFWEI